MQTTLLSKLLRRKTIDTSPSPLRRTLGLFDLLGLGIGATLGSGVYVLTGVIASTAGPGVIISFFISGFASCLAALSYAEFGARVPRAGSAYVYSYVTMGELLAWVTGTQLLLEYVIGTAAVARSWSGYLDTLSNGAISGWLTRWVGGFTVPGLATYLDPLSFTATMLLSLVCALGAKESTGLNNVLTAINIGVVLFVIAVGSRYADVANATPFAPGGLAAIFAGASTSFFA